MTDEKDEDLRDEDKGAGEGDTDSEDSSGEEGAKKGGNKKILIIVAALLVFLIGTGAALFFTGALDSVLGKKTEEHAEGDAAKGHDKKADAHGAGKSGKGGVFIEVPKMIVNLNSDDDVPRYLRLSVQLELDTPEDAAAVETILPRVVDQFQTYLRELRVRDLRGSGGIYRLQMELLWRVNQAAAPVKVKDVLFQEILIQ